HGQEVRLATTDKGLECGVLPRPQTDAIAHWCFGPTALATRGLSMRTLRTRCSSPLVGEVAVALAHPHQPPHSTHFLAQLPLLEHSQLRQLVVVRARVLHL